jgi:Fur family ferric uptake transcriptional regulator
MYKQLLHDAGLKATPARIEVLNLFMKQKKPQNIAQIKVNTKDINTTTLYRMMYTFVQKGIVRPVHVCGDSKFFELTALPHHHHIVCKTCGVIEDFDDCELASVIKQIVNDSNKFQDITEHTFELFGVCKKCMK